MSTLRLSKFIDTKDEWRKNMHYVELTSRHVAATDAHILIKSSLQDVFGFVPSVLKEYLATKGELYIHHDEWKKINNKSIKTIIIKDFGSSVFLEVAFEKKGSTIVKCTKNIKFPKIEYVLPHPTRNMKPVEQTCFDISLFARVSECIKGVRRLQPQFKVTFTGKTGAVMLHHPELQDTVILIMPCTL